MPRPYFIVEKPIMTPYVCIQCGVGGPPREWFVDLGFAVDHYFDVNTQSVYMCNECYHAMTLDIGKLLLQFRKDHEKWESGEQPTYSWMEKNYVQRDEVNELREPESTGQDSGVAGTEQVDAGTPPSTDGNDQDSEPDDPESEPTDSGDAESTDDSNLDVPKGLRITFGEG